MVALALPNAPSLDDVASDAGFGVRLEDAVTPVCGWSDLVTGLPFAVEVKNEASGRTETCGEALDGPAG
jgi:hypothetical protein